MPVYFIQAGDAGAVKIGVAKDVRQRLDDLQVSNAAELVVLHVYEGGAKEEAMLHARFAEHRVAGEWFRPVPEVLAGDASLPPIPVLLRGYRAPSRVPKTPFQKAVRQMGLEAFRSQANVARRTVFNWQKFGVPADKVALVSRLTGLPPAEVRPDLAALFHGQAA